MTSARILVPLVITPSMIITGTTIPEPAAGETAWVSGGTYILNDERTYAGSIYTCVKAHSGSSVLPPGDAINWLRKGPTLRMAPFDDYTATTASYSTALTYVIQPGFFDGINIYGAKGATYLINVTDSVGGTLIATKSGDLYEQAIGLWELAFAPLPTIDRIYLDSIPLHPTAVATITIYGATASVGDIKLGGWRILIGEGSSFGGVQYGASSERKTYTSRVYNFDGTYKTILRGTYRDIACTLKMSEEQSMYTDAILGEIQDIAVPFQATDIPSYGYLDTLGFVSATMQAEDFGMTSIDIKIKGNI